MPNVIQGTALLAACTLIGILLGQMLGAVLGIDANIGGVGIAMLLLIAARLWLAQRGWLTSGITTGVGFWAALYIPIVVAMAATQNVVGALKAGPMVAAAALAAVAACFAMVALISRLSSPNT